MTTSFVHTFEDMCRNSNHCRKTLKMSRMALSEFLHEGFVSGRRLAGHARCESAGENGPFWNSHRAVFVQFVCARAAHVVILLPCTTVSSQGCSCPEDADCQEPARKMRLRLHDVKRLRSWPASWMIPAEKVPLWFRGLVLGSCRGLLCTHD